MAQWSAVAGDRSVVDDKCFRGKRGDVRHFSPQGDAWGSMICVVR